MSPRLPLFLDGSLTLTRDHATVRFTGGPDGQLRIEVADLHTLRELRDAAQSLPGPDAATGTGTRQRTRIAAETLNTLGLTVEIVVAGQHIARLGRNITPDMLSKLMNLGPIDVDKSAVLNLGRQLL
jgi:hypothetical protein